MIVAIEGILARKEPSLAVIKTASGLSYGVSVSLNTSANLRVGEKIELLTTHIVREDASLLYGFGDSKEKSMFDLLIRVSGIGPSTALAVCSSMRADDFYAALMAGDSAVLTKVPGIGPKTAKRIIVELGDAKMALSATSPAQSEAISALVALGFKQERAIKAVAECKSTATDELIKEALKKLA